MAAVSPFTQANLPVWQDPFVEVIKLGMTHRHIGWHTQGDVDQVQDQVLRKNVLKIRGAIAATNYVRIPREMSKSTQGLGLMGRYVYIQLRRARDQSMSIHLDFVTAKKTSLRFTLSSSSQNLRSTGLVLRIPLSLTDQWTCLALDMPQILELHTFNQYNRERYHHLKAVTLCAAMNVRNVFTSDQEYSYETLPSSLRFGDNIRAQYDWQAFPSTSNLQTNESPLSPRGHSKRTAWTPTQQAPPSHTALSPQSRSKLDIKTSPGTREMRLQTNRNHILAQADQIVRTAGCFQDRQDLSGPRTPLQPTQIVKSPRIARKSAAESEITRREWPDPVLSLKHIVGFSSECTNSLLWTPDGSACIYASLSTIVLRSFQNLDSGDDSQNQYRTADSASNQTDDGSSVGASTISSTEYFLRGHCNPITAFALASEPTALLASAERATQQQSAMIRLWDLSSRECLTVIKAQARGVQSMCFSTTRKQTRMICAVGYDEMHRTQITVWDCSCIFTNESSRNSISAVAVVARQTCDFPITRITFSPYEPDQLVSCGRENIRYWRMRNKSMPGWPVVLKEYSRGTVFTDMGFDQLYQAFPSNLPRMRPLYASTSQGTLLVVNYDSREVLCVYKLHDASINCLAMNEGFCVTGSDDRYLRVWPLDFTDFFLEAQHEGGVSSVNVSPDGMKVLVGSNNGAIGILDIAEQRYDSLLRSHTQEVVAMAACSMPSSAETGSALLKQEVVTASLDGTLRIWDLGNAQQSFELDLQNDQVTCLGLYPGNKGILALGFKSGCTRIFNVLQASTQPLHEFQQHQSALCHLAYDVDGEFLYTSAEGQQLCLYDARPDRRYAPVKMLIADFNCEPGRFVLSNDKECLVVTSRDQQHVLLLNSRSLFVASKITLAQHQHGQMQQELATQVLISPTSSELLVLTKSDRMLIYSMQTHDLLQSLVLIGQEGIASFALSPNMKYMATGGSDGSLRVWKCDGRPMITRRHQSFLGQTGAIKGLSFSKDGQSVVGTGTTGTIFIWKFHGDCSQPAVKIPSPVRPLLPGEPRNDQHYSEMRDDRDNKENQHRQPQRITGSLQQDDDSQEMSPSFFIPVPNSKPKSFSLSLASDAFVLAKNAKPELSSASSHCDFFEESVQVFNLTVSTTRQARMQHSSIILGINPALVVWSYPTGKLLFAIGALLVIEGIETGIQSIYDDHGEDEIVSDSPPPKIVLLRLSPNKLRVATITTTLKTVCIRNLVDDPPPAVATDESVSIIHLPPRISAVDALEFIDQGICLACKHFDSGDSVSFWGFDTTSDTILWSDCSQNPSPYRPQIQQLLALPGCRVLSFSPASNRLELHKLQPLKHDTSADLETQVLMESFPSAVHCVHVHTDPANGKNYLIGVDDDAYSVFYDLQRRSVIATTQLLCIKTHRAQIQFQYLSWVTTEDTQLIITGGSGDNLLFVHALPVKANRRQTSVDWTQVARAGLPLLRKIAFDERIRSVSIDPLHPLALVTSDFSVIAVQLTNACTKRILKQWAPTNADGSQDGTQRLHQTLWALESSCVLSLTAKDSTIRCWMPEIAREVAQFHVNSAICTCFAASPGSGYSPGSLIFAGYADSTLRVFDICNMRMIAQCQIPHWRPRPDHSSLKRLNGKKMPEKQTQNGGASLERIYCVGACALIAVTSDQRVLMVDLSGILNSTRSSATGRQTSKLKPNVKPAQEIVYRELAIHDTRRKRQTAESSVVIGSIDLKKPTDFNGSPTIHPFLVTITERSEMNPWAKTSVKVFAHPEMAIAADDRLPVTDEWQITSPGSSVPLVAFTSSANNQHKVVHVAFNASEPDSFHFEVRDYARHCVLQRLVIDPRSLCINFPILMRRFPIKSSDKELLLLADANGSMALLDLDQHVVIPVTGASHLGFHPQDISNDGRLLLAADTSTPNSGLGGCSTLCVATIAVIDQSETDATDS